MRRQGFERRGMAYERSLWHPSPYRRTRKPRSCPLNESCRHLSMCSSPTAILPTPPRTGRGRDERLAGRVRVVGMSIPIASGLVGDLRGVTLRLGSALPSVLPLPAGRRGLPGPAKASGGDRGGRIISQVGRHPRAFDAVPGCGAGRKSPILPNTGVDLLSRPAALAGGWPGPERKLDRGPLLVRVRATGCEGVSFRSRGFML